MALKKTNLAGALSDLFQGKPAFPADTTEAGKKWAQIYRQYATDAQAGATLAVAAALSGAETLLATALGGAFQAAGGAGPAGMATLLPLLDAAFVKFWLTPIPFATPPPPSPPTMTGVVTVAPPGALAGLLAAAFAAGMATGASASSQADAIATALDAWTRTVQVVNTPVTPPGPPAPPVPLA